MISIYRENYLAYSWFTVYTCASTGHTLSSKETKEFNQFGGKQTLQIIAKPI